MESYASLQRVRKDPKLGDHKQRRIHVLCLKCIQRMMIFDVIEEALVNTFPTLARQRSARTSFSPTQSTTTSCTQSDVATWDKLCRSDKLANSMSI
eukprot:55459-Amphidinium_carterae.3